MSIEDVEEIFPKSMMRGKKDETEKINEISKLFEKRIIMIVKKAVLKEREVCAFIALNRQNLYTDIGQKNACKEIYSSIMGRMDNKKPA